MMKKIFISLSMIILGLYCTSAQEVSLVTSGEGGTKAEATAAALRSAIEQTFETFVSANTTILNDDIVKDEVATVASGNIKSFKELSSTKDANGIYTVTVSAIVSPSNLISYAKSHGSSAEFAGATFAMNIKMLELNKKNEKEALQNLVKQLETLTKSIFNYNLKVYDPKQNIHDGTYNIRMQVGITTNPNYVTFFDILNKTLGSLSIKDGELSSMHKSGIYEKELGLNTKTNNDFYKLRNDVNTINNFVDSVCKILNKAQLLFAVREKGKSQGFIPEKETIKRFCSTNYSINGINKTLIVLQQSPGMIHSNEMGRIPLEDKQVISTPAFNNNLTLDELSTVNGFEVIKLHNNPKYK